YTMNSKLLAVATLGLTLTFLMPEAAHSDGGRTYKVTITNLTAGQPLTPPILATHTNRTEFFTVGEAASEGIRQIAENGNGEVLLQALGEDTQVHDVVAGAAPLVPANNPGGTGFASSETFKITAKGRARYLSFASMLICTNDGFTGLDSVRLPRHRVTVYTAGYDARTEANTEAFADIVPPCQGLIGVSGDPGTGMSNPLLAEDGVVIPHAGIHGGVDLVPSVHDWSDPVAKIEIERVRHHDYDDDSDSD
ncbi:MAG: spondin domain-containing protein, partial [Woeseiaceae bacterium]